MEKLYTGGSYLKKHPLWHAEDSFWKAKQIHRIIKKNKIPFENIAEIGCGAGVTLAELSKLLDCNTLMYGYDISPQAIKLAKNIKKDRIDFFLEDLLADDNKEYFDILLIIDVLEHIPDYLNFAEKCQRKARFKIYHVPLDISVASVFSKSYMNSRLNHGHFHYFTYESAIATLKDTNHYIIDNWYNDVGTYYFKKSPTIKRAIINLPRWLLAFFNTTLASRIFGRYSLLVLAK